MESKASGTPHSNFLYEFNVLTVLLNTALTSRVAAVPEPLFCIPLNTVRQCDGIKRVRLSLFH